MTSHLLHYAAIAPILANAAHAAQAGLLGAGGQNTDALIALIGQVIALIVSFFLGRRNGKQD